MAEDREHGLGPADVALLDRHLPASHGVAPRPLVRQELLDLAEAPKSIDVGAYVWQDLFPGVRHVLCKEDPARGMRALLIWAKPGAQSPTHRHLGKENILVLQGVLADHRGTYGPGQICRSEAGSVHSEAVPGGEDCICYAVYYGDLEIL